MKGSEKQISWAIEIQSAVTEAMNDILRQTASDPKFASPEAQSRLQRLIKARDAVASGDYYAGDLIEIYRDILERKPAKERQMLVWQRVYPRLQVAYSNMALIGQ